MTATLLVLLPVLVLLATGALLWQTQAGVRLLNLLNSCSRCRVCPALPYGPHVRQRLDLYVPPGTREAPTVLFFYGGRWRTGKRQEYRFVADALTRRGVLVAVADYRLFPEVGWQDFIEDGACAYAWLEQHVRGYGGNPGRIFVMGHSAGAYIAAMVALDPGVRARAAAQGRPAGLIGLAGPYDFFPFTDEDVREVFRSAPDGHGTQPVHYVGPRPAPALLLTGKRDRTVDPENSARLLRRLQAHGGQAELVQFARLGHVGILLSLAYPFRFLAPTSAAILRFIQDA